jgi:hypothetical protein
MVRMMQGTLNLLAFVIPPLFICIGVFLLFFKRKCPAGINPTAWIDQLDLPEFAKEVRRKEANKQTAKILTFAWLKEYCQGKRTAFSAWFCWLFCLPLVSMVSIFILFPLFMIFKYMYTGSLPSPDSAYFETFGIFASCYIIFANFILWKCLANSKRIWKYIIRVCSILIVIKILYQRQKISPTT